MHRPRQHPQSLEKLIRHLHPLSLEVHWIRGNHDRNLLRTLPETWEVHSNAFELGPFLLRNESSDENTSDFQICGHMHPSVKIIDGREKLRLHCFAVNSQLLMLSSFDELTEEYELIAGEWERFMLCLENEVCPLEAFDLEPYKKRT